jgi:hypothetical protein
MIENVGIPCAFCDLPVMPHVEGVYAEQSGWSVTRTAGGSNQLSLRRETGRYAHGHCIRLAVRGVDPRDQGALL